MPLMPLKWRDVAQTMEQFRDPLFVQYFELVKDLRELSSLLRKRCAELDINQLVYDVYVCCESLHQENMLQIREFWVHFFADHNFDVRAYLPDLSNGCYLGQLGFQNNNHDMQSIKFYQMQKILDEIGNELKILADSPVKLLSWFVELYAQHPQNKIWPYSRYELRNITAALGARRDFIDLSLLPHQFLFALEVYYLNTEALVERMAKDVLAKFSLLVLEVLRIDCSKMKRSGKGLNVALWLEPMIEEAIVEKQATSSCNPPLSNRR